MKKFNSIIQLIIITVVLFATSSALAQTGNGMSSPEAMASQQTKYIAEQLKLEGQQVKDLNEINLLYAQQMNELGRRSSGENSKSEVEALKRSHSNKIRSLLSSEKYREYLALQKKEDEKEKQLEKKMKN